MEKNMSLKNTSAKNKNRIMKLYPWQKKLLSLYNGCGIVKVAPGGGKTFGAIQLIKNKKYKNVIVAVPTLPLKSQWEKELKEHNVTADVHTYHYLSKNHDECDLLVVDECHRSVSPIFKKLYENINYKFVIGLSATPNEESEKFCGTIIIDVSFEESNIADFKVVFASIELTPRERAIYDRLSYGLQRAIEERDEMFYQHQRKNIDAIIFKRRSIVYSARQRIPKTIELIKRNEGKNILLICQRIKQADELSELTGYPVFHSKNRDEDTLKKFKDGQYKCLISVGMLKEGFDKRDIDVVIIASTAVTEAHHIQSIGRGIRLPNDAVIYVILANDTTDEKLLKFRSKYKHEIEGSFTGKYSVPISSITQLYYKSKRYSLDHKNRIFKPNNTLGRKYCEYNPIIDVLKKYLPIGGRFRITKNNEVLVMTDRKKKEIVCIGILKEPLNVIEESEKIDYNFAENW